MAHPANNLFSTLSSAVFLIGSTTRQAIGIRLARPGSNHIIWIPGGRSSRSGPAEPIVVPFRKPGLLFKEMF
ncbi:hypothetical protein IG631_08453 [Alternaria alternata]|nr:hypothetical protein IG631_08453 [Alternaria alternata]